MPHDGIGIYLDGRTAARRPVTVRLLPDGLELLTDQGETRAWPYHEIRRTHGRFAGEQARFERGAPIAEALLIDDRALLDALYQRAPRLGANAYHPSRRLSRIGWTAAAAVAAIGATTALLAYGVPALVGVLTPRIPISWDVRLGEAVLDYFADADDRCDDPALYAAINAIFASTVGPVGAQYPFHLIVLDTPELNAFAAPGGPIVILRGLLRRTDTPEELAGVLAHEAQHIIRRHSTRALLQQASAGLVIAALTGDVSGAAAFGLNAAANLGALRYSRAHETEADEHGLRMILDAGIDPAGMIAFFELLAREGPELPGVLAYLSTHPASDERAQRLRTLAAQAAQTQTALGSREEWHAIRERCRVDPKPDAD
ncbi:MAG: M48 family metallopeptidase [Nitrospirota bacterium]